MNFEELCEKIDNRLKGIARRRGTRVMAVDADDLYQEMRVYLWDHYKDGLPEGINESYVVKGCEFYILNHIRKHLDKAGVVSMDQPVNDDGDLVRDTIPDKTIPIGELLDNEIIEEAIRNSAANENEKAVFFLLIEGDTTREAGEKLRISHVMVSKYKKSLAGRLREKGLVR